MTQPETIEASAGAASDVALVVNNAGVLLTSTAFDNALGVEFDPASLSAAGRADDAAPSEAVRER